MVKATNMIGYGMSLIGRSHLEKNGICQDAHKIAELKNGWFIVAVADGVGSSKHSDIASKMAIDFAIEFVSSQELIWGDILVSDILPKVYEHAQRKIEEYAVAQNDEFHDYDTTMDLVIYNGEEIVFGHSGDGGIVGLTNDGDYIPITKPQKGSDGFTVLPLRARGHWEFGKRNEKFASILLATDGVYDQFFPYLLRGQKNEVYVPLIRFFMDNGVLGITSKNQEKTRKEKELFLISDAAKSISDDKTVAVIFNQKICPKEKEKSFYEEPDWDALQIEWNKKAYPHLYKDDLKK